MSSLPSPLRPLRDPWPQVTGSVRGKPRAQVDEGLASGNIDIAVGTHALISDSTHFQRLGLAIVDEQHKCAVQPLARPPLCCCEQPRCMLIGSGS